MSGTGGADAFSGIAADYDALFSATPLGRMLRRALWRHLDPLVEPDSDWLVCTVECEPGRGWDVHRSTGATCVRPTAGICLDRERKRQTIFYRLGF